MNDAVARQRHFPRTRGELEHNRHRHFHTFLCAGKWEKRKEVGRWAVRCWKFAYFILKRRLKRILISKTSIIITAIAIYFK